MENTQFRKIEYVKYTLFENLCMENTQFRKICVWKIHNLQKFVYGKGPSEDK